MAIKVPTKNGVLSISVMSGKLEGFHSLNTDSIDNKFCRAFSSHKNSICSKCYSRKQLGSYRKNSRPSFLENGRILSERLLEDREIPYIADKVFRFHSHGELINDIHFQNLVKICQLNPGTTFTLWTKVPQVVIEVLDEIGKPENLILILSDMYLDRVGALPPVPRYFDKTFSVWTEKGAENGDITINCKKKCRDCMLCYQKNNVNRIHELVK